MNNIRIVSRRKRTKVSQLQQVIALSRQCSLAMENGATDRAFELMTERDELCKTLTPEDSKAFLDWGWGSMTAEEKRAFGEALGAVFGLLEEA